MLGFVTKPVLSQLGEIHSAEHAVQSALHDAEHPEDHLDSDHTKGMHGLLHQSVLGGAYTEITTAILVPGNYGAAALVTGADRSPIPERRLTQPFRPPIA